MSKLERVLSPSGRADRDKAFSSSPCIIKWCTPDGGGEGRGGEGGGGGFGGATQRVRTPFSFGSKKTGCIYVFFFLFGGFSGAL